MLRRIPSRYSLYAGASIYSQDVLNYFRAGGITSATEKSAVNTLINGLKAAGIYSKLERLWLCSPTSSSAALLDFITLTSMTNNGATFTTNGWSFNGTSSWLDTGYIPQNSLNLSTSTGSFGANVYSGTPSGTQAIFGAIDEATLSKILITCGVSGSNLVWSGQVWNVLGAMQYTVNSSTEVVGFRVVSRTATNLQSFYQNGCPSLQTGVTNNTALPTNASIAIGGQYDDNTGTTGVFFNGVINLAFAGKGLTASEIQTFDELQAAYHYALGRYTYTAKANTYFTNASIATNSFTERYAANRLIGEMEARNLWSKISRLYLVSPTSKTASRTCAKTGNLLTDVNSVYWDTTNGFGFNGSSNLLRADAATNTMTEITGGSAFMFCMFNDPSQYPAGAFMGQDNVNTFALGGDFLV